MPVNGRGVEVNMHGCSRTSWGSRPGQASAANSPSARFSPIVASGLGRDDIPTLMHVY